MAFYKITENKKGELVAKLQTTYKDKKTGKRKNVCKNVHNENNLTAAKFNKYIEKLAIQFEAEVLEEYKKQNEINNNTVLTFSKLANEFLENIKRNLSINYYSRAKEVVARFNKHLENNGLSKSPINDIKVRDIQLFFDSFQYEGKKRNVFYVLKKELPKGVNFRELERKKIIDRCSCYELRNYNRRITKPKAERICNYCDLKFDEYFDLVTDSARYSTETIKGYRRVIRTIFNEAVRYEWIDKNPVCRTKIGGSNTNSTLIPIREKQVYSIAEAKQFLEYVNEIDDEYIYKKIIFKFMILTGVRVSEMCGLQWNQIDFDKKIVHICKTRQKDNEFGIYEKGPKSKTSIRDIPLTDSLIEDLKKYQEWFRLADKNFDNKLDKYYVAVNIYREPICRDPIGTWLKKFQQQKHIKQVSCHGLRHTYCSLLLAQNVPIQTVSKYMGHSDSTITLQVYSHFIPDTQQKVVNALNNLL